jgi:hypothetical protein
MDDGKWSTGGTKMEGVLNTRTTKRTDAFITRDMVIPEEVSTQKANTGPEFENYPRNVAIRSANVRIQAQGAFQDVVTGTQKRRTGNEGISRSRHTLEY